MKEDGLLLTAYYYPLFSLPLRRKRFQLNSRIRFIIGRFNTLLVLLFLADSHPELPDVHERHFQSWGAQVVVFVDVFLAPPSVTDQLVC